MKHKSIHLRFAAVFFAFFAGVSIALAATVGYLAGSPGAGSANGTGSAASFSTPLAVALDSAGNTYVADTANHIIRVVTSGGVVSTLAGVAGSAGTADGTGSLARFNQPSGIAVDSLTNIWVADTGNHTIRKITPAGVVTTVAGTVGVPGTNNAVGILASFNQPMGLAVDTGNNLYIADYGNHLVRKMTPAFSVSTFAGTAAVFGYANGTPGVFYGPEAVAVDSSGNVFVADTGNAAVRKITSGGAVSLFAGTPGGLGSRDNGTGGNALFFQPAGVAVDSSGNVFVSDYFNQTIRKITSGGVASTLAGAPGAAGSADGTNSQSRFFGPQGLALNASGTLCVADSVNNTIRTVTSAGLVSTLAGAASEGTANGPAQVARFFSPQAVAMDSSGNLYIADAQNSTIRKITFSGVVSVLAGFPGAFGGADGSGTNAQFAGPQGIALDSSGSVYVADTGNHTIRKITGAGIVSTLAGLAGQPGNADGTGTNAQFLSPIGICVDSANNVYVADTGNHTIRKITSGGLVTTLAGWAGYFGSADGATNNARFNEPVGVAVDGSGTLFVTDFNNHTVRQITAAGVVTTLAGYAGIWGSADGANNGALFFGPMGIAVDGSGNLYIADSGNHTIRKLSPSGPNWVSSTLFGVADSSGSGTGAGNSTTQFYFPSAVSVNSAGYLFIVDAGNNSIRTSENLPAITWATPSPITYGTALSGSQLNASANVPGTITYNPASGTIPDSGPNMLLATLTPSNTTTNRGASASVTLSVLPASLTVTANSFQRVTNAPNPVFTGVINGIQNSDNISASYNSIATSTSPAGNYPIAPSLIDPNNRSTNYNVTLVNGILTIFIPPLIQSESWSSNKFTFTFSSVSNQMYQIQYSTNLALNIWSNLGPPITATNSFTAVSDTNSAPFRLYRLTLYP